MLDRTEDLMYRYQTMIESLELRGHSVVIFQQADNSYFPELSNRRLSLFKSTPNFVDNFEWCAVQWQHQQGVPYQDKDYTSIYGDCPVEMRHRIVGEHLQLNDYLTDYVHRAGINV